MYKAIIESHNLKYVTDPITLSTETAETISELCEKVHVIVCTESVRLHNGFSISVNYSMMRE